MREFKATCLSPDNYKDRYSEEPNLKQTTVELLDPIEFISSDPFDEEERFNKSKLSFMNPYTSGNEAYFGENNEFKIKLVLLIGELRILFNGATNTESKRSVRKDYVKEIEDISKKFEVLIEKAFNIEKCYFGMFEELNAFSYPLCWDANLAVVEKKEGSRIKNLKVNNPFKASLEDIVETKNGYKYKDSKGKIYVIGLGLGFFRNDYTDEEIGAVILHELGHAMQQAMCSINENLASSFISNTIQGIWSLLDPFMAVGSLGISLLVSIGEAFVLGNIKKMDTDELGDEIIIQAIGSAPNEYKRENFGENLMDHSKQSLKRLPEEKKENKFLNFVGRFFFGFIAGLITTGVNILYPFLYLVNIPRHILLATNNAFLQKNKRFEQFADMFSASYGFGSSHASALAKLGDGHKVNLYTLNWLNYVPVLNVAIAVGSYMRNNISCLLAGYPDMKKRIVGVYKTVKYELENNKDLTPQQKKELTDQIDALNVVYDEYVFDYGPKGFVYALWHKITVKTLANESSDIEGNVLDIMKEMNESYKMKEAKENKEKKEKVSVSKTRIRKSILNIIKDLKSNNILSGFTNKFTNI